MKFDKCDKEVQEEIQNMINALPPRFKEEFENEVLQDTKYDMKTLDKTWSYYIDEIIDEMEDIEKLRYDFGYKDELEKMKENIAIETGEYWANNGTDDEFADNCINSICQQLEIYEEGVLPEIVYDIWNIIEKKYC